MAIIRLGASPTHTRTLGELSFGVPPQRYGGIALAAFAPSRLPLNVQEGLADERNVFQPGWRAFCGWALSEELHPELVLRHDESLIEVKLLLRIAMLPRG